MSGKKNPKARGLSNQALKEFRSKVAKLKKKGVISSRVDARSQAATKYMRAKVRKFEDVLSGQSFAIKAKPEIRHKYTDAGLFEERGSFLVVPKEHSKSRARIKKGRDLIEITTPLKWGEEREVILPFKATDMMDLAEQLEAGGNIDHLKNGDEQFAFRLYGHNSRKAFINNEEFVDHILRNYQHLFKGTTRSSGKAGRDAVKHLSVIRFKGYAEDVPKPNENLPYYEEPTYSLRYKDVDAKGRNSGRLGSYEKQKRERLALRKKKARSSETEAERENRLAKQRQRTARNKQRKFDDK